MSYLSNVKKIPNSVLVGIMLEAQKLGFETVKGYEPTWTIIEHFWYTYNSEFRDLLERWVMQNANLTA